ncbi:ubiquinone biosynthesis protein [Paraburkholderia sp. HC6.4b]|uniref:ABC1 kinase family protein n=1 Tax=unclassified Paraburkholderia TaxID=2615204 RepID=UPI00160B78DD|nr:MULTISPECIES: AarF/UbiB family protein [unclassified Paraburkholderia]MBB5413464.1 ubiquinone biosynthesis protein [Paraburkholderia sp. HC6.4b]MBB5455745.1 ubiquinone biosynthesis protein [Paraburkholderia sp. Kb1A]
MPPLFRRLLLLFHALRYGARLIWLAAPPDHKLHWMIELIGRVHASERSGAQLHGLLPALGPLASRFAQTLARRPELASGTLHDALDAIDHMEVPLSPDDSALALTRAFGRPLGELFSAVDLVPVRSGFAEQTHFARLAMPLKGHHEVAVKLVRAQQLQQIGDELALLRWVARWLEKLSRVARRLQLRALAQTFTDDILRRFDLRAEAANLSQTGHDFDGDKRIVVPDVIWELCTDHTLTMQRVNTLSASDLPGLHAHGIKLAPLAAHIVEVVTEQAFEHGFFHATLDARRVRVSIEPDTLGRLVLAEFSIMATLSSDEREFFVHGATALFDQDYGRLADMHREAGHVPDDTRAELLEAELRTRAEAHFAAAPEDRSAGSLFHHLLHGVQPFDGHVPGALATAQRSFQQAEMLARALHPGIDTWNIARGVLADIARRDLDHRGWLKRLSHELPHLAHMLPRVPQLAVRYLQQHDRTGTPQQNAQLLADLAREYRRTRWLLWACVVCGGVLGAGMTLLAW